MNLPARRRATPIVVESVGRPAAVSSLAKLLLTRQKAKLATVPRDDESRSPVPAVEQGPLRRFD